MSDEAAFANVEVGKARATTDTFVDTNILIYSYDRDAGAKHERAREVVRNLWRDEQGVLSVQVLSEFYVNATKKLKSPFEHDRARQIVNDYRLWCVDTGFPQIADAFQIQTQAHIGYWDALIVAAARKAGATRILSEHLNAGQIIAGVRIENPLL